MLLRRYRCIWKFNFSKKHQKIYLKEVLYAKVHDLVKIMPKICVNKKFKMDSMKISINKDSEITKY